MGEQISADVRDALKGLDELERKLQRKGIRTALRAGAKVTHAVARSTAPEQAGLLKRNVKVRSAGVKQGTYRVNVGIGKKWFTGPAFYGAFVAFGHRVGDRRLGDSRRQLAPNEWLEKAYDTTKTEAVDVFKETLIDFIERGGE